MLEDESKLSRYNLLCGKREDVVYFRDLGAQSLLPDPSYSTPLCFSPQSFACVGDAQAPRSGGRRYVPNPNLSLSWREGLHVRWFLRKVFLVEYAGPLFIYLFFYARPPFLYPASDTPHTWVQKYRSCPSSTKACLREA